MFRIASCEWLQFPSMCYAVEVVLMNHCFFFFATVIGMGDFPPRADVVEILKQFVLTAQHMDLDTDALDNFKCTCNFGNRACDGRRWLHNFSEQNF